MKHKTADKPSNLPRPTFLDSLLEEEKTEQLCKGDPWHSPFPGFLDSVYEEERAIELMLRAHVSGDQERVGELVDHILEIRKQSETFPGFPERG